MPLEVVLPMVGITVEKGRILSWSKKEGDRVKRGEALCVVEIDKVTTEVESPATGVLSRIVVPEGKEVPVLAVIAEIEAEGAATGATRPGAPPPPPPPPAPEPRAAAASRPVSGKASSHPCDLVIVGGGPGGYMAAIQAAKGGANVVLAEKYKLGGTCLHTGCIPTKTFLSRAHILEKVRGSAVFTGREHVGVDMAELVSVKDDVVRNLGGGLISLLEGNGVTVLKGEAAVTAPGHVTIREATGKTLEVAGKDMIIATGARPRALPGIEPDGRLVHSTDTIFNLKTVPERVLIVGAGAVGVEFASILAPLGSQVTLVEVLPQMLPLLDSEVAEALRISLERRGVEILTSTRINGLEKGERAVRVKMAGPDGPRDMTFDMVLLSVGRAPNTEGLGLDALGVRIERGAVVVNGRMETGVSGVYAIGDVIGGVMLAHAAFSEAAVAIDNIFGRPREIDYRKIPNCIYSFPEVACVGITEDEARKSGVPYCAGRFPLRFNARAVASGETEGVVKVLTDPATGEILGAHIIGENATELISECVLAMTAELTVEDLSGAVTGHPTLSEAVTEAALELVCGAFHLPRKK